LRRSCTAFICGVILLCAQEGCSPDPRTIRGTLGAAAHAVEIDDGRALFDALDCRARDALHSISRDRRASARLIQAEYPADERAEGLRELGDAVRARDAADLFSMRCARACRARLGASLGAPVGRRGRGDDVEVATTRGGRIHLHRCADGAWGLVWNTTELAAERRRAAREHSQIERNVQIYRRRRALAAALETGVAAP